MTAGQTDGGLRVVKAGLTIDDWVVVSGIQGLRPGMNVKPESVLRMGYVGKGPSSARRVRCEPKGAYQLRFRGPGPRRQGGAPLPD